MKDPIITPDGICYERATILEHLQRNGPTDPTSRRPLRTNQIIADKSMKQAIEIFSSENPWAFDFISGDEKFANIDL